MENSDSETKKKIYYDSDGDVVICDRVYASEHSLSSREVTQAEFDGTFSHPYTQKWTVKDGKLALADDEDRINDEYNQAMLKRNEIASLQGYLDETDYVITKLQEISLTGTSDEFDEAKAKYADVIAKRKETRQKLKDIGV